jgi:hypothetical protein
MSVPYSTVTLDLILCFLVQAQFSAAIAFTTAPISPCCTDSQAFQPVTRDLLHSYCMALDAQVLGHVLSLRHEERNSKDLQNARYIILKQNNVGTEP